MAIAIVNKYAVVTCKYITNTILTFLKALSIISCSSIEGIMDTNFSEEIHLCCLQ